MASKIAPLPATFFLASVIGFLISIFFIPTIPGGLSWAFAFAVLFFIMLIAAIISMVRARPRPQLKIR